MELYTEMPIPELDAHRTFFPTFGVDMFPTDEKHHMSYYYPQHSMWPTTDSSFHQGPCLADVHDNTYLSGYDTPLQYNLAELENFKLPISNEIHSMPSKTSQKRKRTSKEDEQPNTRICSQRPSPRSTVAPETPTSSSTPNVRKHYAVEKRYRSTLNDRYATLARLVSDTETQQICRAECAEWEVPYKLECGSAGRQSKTTTLSVAIDTIALLDRACNRKAKEYENLLGRLNGIVQGAGGSRAESVRQ